MPEMNTDYVTYKGSTSDTVSISVDNTTGVIRGSVITTGILGDTVNKAYPGNLGAKTSKELKELTSTLNKEISKCITSNKGILDSLTALIEKEEQDRILIDNELAQSYSTLAERVSASESNIVVINNTINILKSRIDTLTMLQTTVTDITKRLTDVEYVVSDIVNDTHIEDEITDLKAIIENLTSGVCKLHSVNNNQTALLDRTIYRVTEVENTSEQLEDQMTDVLKKVSQLDTQLKSALDTIDFMLKDQEKEITEFTTELTTKLEIITKEFETKLESMESSINDVITKSDALADETKNLSTTVDVQTMKINSRLEVLEKNLITTDTLGEAISNFFENDVLIDPGVYSSRSNIVQ